MGSEHQSSERDRLTSDEWRRICAVLDRVLDAESSDPRSIVEHACRAEGVAIADAVRYLKATREDASFLKHLDPALITAALGPATDCGSLSAGTRLGHYEVLAPIGAGGMADVYRAHDTTLDRDVALKVLPPRFAIDAERLMRFKREAHVLASLNHPNVAAIYGIEEFTSDSRPGEVVLALALEFVEGHTLADRLAGGPLASGAALSIAHQIIDSLEAAHEAGIVHRDLKPSNIKLRESTTGRGHDVVVKVLDFGVAKVLKAIEPDIYPARVNEATHDCGTRVGAMIGTIAYMAPEQIDGKAVDQRADIWAFGCVLYEMLTGARAFNGCDVSETLEQIAIRDPDWTRLPVDTPSNVRRLLRRCLERDRRRRLAHIADARLDLDEADADRPTDPDGRKTPQRAMRAALRTTAAFVVAFGVAITGWLWGRQVPREPPLVTRLSIPVAGNIDQPAVSPDGSQVAFVSRVPTRRIVTRRLDHTEQQSIAGTEDATVPTFSPDGHWLAYRTSVQIDGADVSLLKKIPVTGGAAVTLVDSVAPNGGHVSWGEDGYIYYVDEDVRRVRSAGGPPQRVIARNAANGDIGFSNPTLLPGGAWLLFTVSVAPTQAGEPGHMRVVAFNLATGERRVLLPDDGPATYAQTDPDPSASHLLYERDGSLFAVPFDAKRVETKGAAIRVIEPSEPVTLAPNLPVGVSTTGTLAYVVRRGEAAVQMGTLVWVDRHGTETPIPDLPSGPYSGPRISPDGTRAAVNILRGSPRGVLSDIWTYDFATRRLMQTTFDGRSIDRSAVWSRDGRRLIYTARTDGQTTELAEVPADGSGVPVRLQSAPHAALEGPSVPVPRSLSPDGKFLIGTVAGGGRPAVFRMVLDPAGTSSFEPLLDTRMVERNPQYSPNGRWVAYESNRSGRRAIWVAPDPNPAGRWQQVSTDRGSDPKWSGTGGELFYRDGNKMMVVAVDTGTSFHAGAPKLLFEGNYRDDYDVSPDGRRFLMVKAAGSPIRSASDANRELHIVVNWFEELRRLSPIQH